MKLLKLIALLCIPLPGLAQTSVQVVTKVIEKDLPYTNGQRLHLNAQKADVTIKGWNRPTVSVTLRLVAKHPDRSVAEREVAYHQYTLQTNGNELDLSNRFVIPQRAGKLQSQLKAIYEVSVPSKAILSLNNSFGDVTLRELSGDVSLKFEFGRLTLDDVAGKLNITSEYGDVDGRGVNATLVCKAQKADISLLDLGGTSHIESRYGKLTIVPNAATLNALRVEAARTDIVFSPQRVADFRYDVMAAQSTIRVPEAYSSQVGSYGGRQTFTLQPAGRKTEIIIHNTYSPVTIQGERSFSSK
ncbi:hypothetical protein DYU11_19020 [Fibrisoma montanum]|uniref:DUF4097 domain-containing protein n=1 Tax=Fibrisoma montanum TaxID=2305895 RepID=A0A418M6V9_9BACT|nr:DUF4097 family beta strand repeat-containing protein [Fibrisoma montanum]RIV21495.1 hypothetical protein DYU11_19020 [Fibrisoma montanum]